MSGMIDMNTQWILCPVCGNKTRDKIRTDTVLKNDPLYCPKGGASETGSDSCRSKAGNKSHERNHLTETGNFKTDDNTAERLSWRCLHTQFITERELFEDGEYCSLSLFSDYFRKTLDKSSSVAYTIINN